MVTYMTLWSPIGYMEYAINHDCRGAGGTKMCLLGSYKESRDRKHTSMQGTLLGKDTRSL